MSIKYSTSTVVICRVSTEEVKFMNGVRFVERECKRTIHVAALSSVFQYAYRYLHTWVEKNVCSVNTCITNFLCRIFSRELCGFSGLHRLVVKASDCGAGSNRFRIRPTHTEHRYTTTVLLLRSASEEHNWVFLWLVYKKVVDRRVSLTTYS